LLKHRSHPLWLIALDFNGSSSHGSSTTAAHPNLFGDGLNRGEGQVSCELVDNNDSLSAAMSRFPTQYDSAELPERDRGLVSGRRMVRSFRQVHLGKRILQFGQRLR
jgi:hypothetical protein